MAAPVSSDRHKGCLRKRVSGWLAGLAGSGSWLLNLDLLVRSQMGVLQCILYALQYALIVLSIHHGWGEQNHEFGSVR